MKIIISLFLGLLLSSSLYAQDDKIKEYILQGIELHDQGRFKEAIAKYKAALEIDANSAIVNYELSLTYYSTQNYEEAAKYSKKVVDLNSEHLDMAYMILGSSLDMSGKANEAIVVFEEGIKKFPNSNLLNYNLALTAFNNKDLAKAEQSIINAINAKTSHASSHLILGNIQRQLGSRVKALMSYYYFLMLEPKTERSTNVLKILTSLQKKGLQKESENKLNINLDGSAMKDTVFGAIEMFVSMQGAFNMNEKNKDKSEIELFIETTRSFFSITHELKKNKSNFWFDFYDPKFYDLIQSKNIEAFCYYISQSSDKPEIQNWLNENQEKVESLKEWINK